MTGAADGIGVAAQFNTPTGVAVSSAGRIYVTTQYSHRIVQGTPLTPTLTLSPASNVLKSTATLNGLVNPNGSSTTAQFEYGPTTSYGSTAPATLSPNNGTSAQSVSANITNLATGALYHYSLSATNAKGADVSVDGTFTTLTFQQYWRQQYFGTTANTGNAADDFDFDGDGLVNLLEWVCGLVPTNASTPDITIVPPSGGNIEFHYPRSVDAVNAGTGFIVEWSDTLASGSWDSAGVSQQVLSGDGTLQQMKATLPAGSEGMRFVRLRVTAP